MKNTLLNLSGTGILLGLTLFMVAVSTPTMLGKLSAILCPALCYVAGMIVIYKSN